MTSRMAELESIVAGVPGVPFKEARKGKAGKKSLVAGNRGGAAEKKVNSFAGLFTKPKAKLPDASPKVEPGVSSAGLAPVPGADGGARARRVG